MNETTLWISSSLRQNNGLVIHCIVTKDNFELILENARKKGDYDAAWYACIGMWAVACVIVFSIVRKPVKKQVRFDQCRNSP